MMKRYLIGIDEAGRGPLAGPVAVGGVMVERSLYPMLKRRCRSILGKDSKKLSEKQREEWFIFIQQMQQERRLTYTATLVGARIIDKEGIVPAIHVGIERIVSRLKADPGQCEIRLDGGLKASDRFTNQQTIVKGDERELVIGLASIVAKVTRDRKMVRLDKKYRGYAFAKHKGYGTSAHYTAITKLGLSAIHRRSFVTDKKGTHRM